jgi:hypothetical protein
MRQVLFKLATAILAACCAVSSFGSTSEDLNDAPVSQPSFDQWALLELPYGIRPAAVRAEFHLLDIQKVNDDDETFEFSGVLTLIWQDSRQSFDPTLTGVDEMIFHGGYQFNELAPAWYPQAVITNAADVQETQGVLLRVQPDGTSKLIQTVNATVRSPLNLRLYPFDLQRLLIIFEILGFDDSEVAIAAGKITDDREGIQIPQWDLMDITASTTALAAPYAGSNGRSSALVVELDVKRQRFLYCDWSFYP